ncbi:MAG TPA: hypothetical protein PKB14_10400 [Rubrivivax sp.]|nr:hypothetical protein [Rubrivivax sp.]
MRFAHGLRVLAPELFNELDAGARNEPVVHVDIVRCADLVVLSVDAVGCELVGGDAEPAHLRPMAGFAYPRLVVGFAFQHIGEQALYEGRVGGKLPVPDEFDHAKPPSGEPAPPGHDPNARITPPVAARAARGSRLVFTIPAGETIEFSSAGLLAAMGRLELALHKLAAPGNAPTTGRTGEGPRVDPGHLVVALPGGLVAKVSGDAVAVSKASASLLHRLDAPAPGSLAGIAFQASELRRLRPLLQTRAAIAVRGIELPDHHLLRLGGLVGEVLAPLRRLPRFSHPPSADETSIEAPYRLLISPGSEARWVHVNEPSAAAAAPRHVELWHTRLGSARQAADGTIRADERNSGRRIVRAIWARDRDAMAKEDWQDPTSPNPGHVNNDPFRTSLDPADRHMLVRQSSETLIGARGSIDPVPIGAHALWLSALGAWLDLHGAWTTKPYSEAAIRSILAWDHVAPLGRDQYVRVVYPGYLYPWGHQAALVKVTERKMKDAAPSVAGLYQRKFLVIGERRRTYPDRRDLPFIEASIRPLVTPVIDEPGGALGDSQDDFFWPRVGGQAFEFIVDALDHGGRPVRLQMPLLWVAEHFQDFAAIDKAYDADPRRKVVAHGQQVAFAPAAKGGDTVVAAATLAFQGKAELGTSTPRMSSAEVLIPAVQQLSPTGPVPIAYHPAYKVHGFAGAANSGELWARVLVQGEQTPEHATDPVKPLPVLRFGAGAPSGSEKSGGFLTPDVPIRGLSRLTGTVGDAAGMAKQSFDPKAYFKDSSPKLFGLIDLGEVTVTVDSDLARIPKIISELVGRVEGLVEDIGRAGEAIADAIAEANRMAAQAADKTADLQAAAQAALDAANDAKSSFDDLSAKLPKLLELVQNNGQSDPGVGPMFTQFKAQVEDTVNQLEIVADHMPPYLANVVRALADGLRSVILGAVDLVADIERYVTGLAESGALARVRFEWKPRLASWPSAGAPLLQVKEDSLVFAIEAKTGLDGRSSAHAMAEMRDFALHLFPDAELLALKFDRFMFKAGSSGKPEVDIVLHDIEFKGVLSFVEGIKDLIPLDGFSDPPNLAVTAEGMTAGFTLALPNVAVGAFSITNLSLGADVLVPFLGKAVSIGFNFCTRDRPFTITVMFLGGGGWAGIRASAHGLEVLEIGLEAGACIAVDFGVASGSVSAMLGVYIRLESEKGSIAGYFRLRGEVDVLGLVSAAIELYMELMYQPPTGKLIGQASITVNVSVVGISKSVRVSARRVFAGSRGDPSFLEVMDAGSGSSEPWTAYCLAFLGE